VRAKNAIQPKFRPYPNAQSKQVAKLTNSKDIMAIRPAGVVRVLSRDLLVDGVRPKLRHEIAIIPTTHTPVGITEPPRGLSISNPKDNTSTTPIIVNNFDNL
jgi:hypothetical protein